VWIFGMAGLFQMLKLATPYLDKAPGRLQPSSGDAFLAQASTLRAGSRPARGCARLPQCTKSYKKAAFRLGFERRGRPGAVQTVYRQ
jgi:hypothetical protein